MIGGESYTWNVNLNLCCCDPTRRWYGLHFKESGIFLWVCSIVKLYACGSVLGNCGVIVIVLRKRQRRGCLLSFGDRHNFLIAKLKCQIWVFVIIKIYKVLLFLSSENWIALLQFFLAGLLLCKEFTGKRLWIHILIIQY